MNWTPTMELRHRWANVYGPEWLNREGEGPCQWSVPYLALTTEQLWRCDNGDTEWRKLPVAEWPREKSQAS
jgi:hypothetical protein